MYDESKTKCNIEKYQYKVNKSNKILLETDEEYLEDMDELIFETISPNPQLPLLTKELRSCNEPYTTDYFVLQNSYMYNERLKKLYDDNTYHYYDFIQIGNKEYEITYTSGDTYGYFMYDGDRIDIIVEQLNELNSSVLFENSGVTSNIVCTDKVCDYMKYDFGKYVYSYGYLDLEINKLSDANVIKNRIYTSTIYDENDNSSFLIAHIPYDKMDYVINESGLTFNTNVFYGVNRYTFVDIDGRIYKINTTIANDMSYKQSIDFGDKQKFRYRIINKTSRTQYICRPIVDILDNIDPVFEMQDELSVDIDNLYKIINEYVVNNFSDFKFYYRSENLALRKTMHFMIQMRMFSLSLVFLKYTIVS